MVFDELVRLFEGRELIPDEAEFPKVRPNLESYEFPHALLPDDHLRAFLDPARLRSLRDAISSNTPANGGAARIKYFAPWFDAAVVEPESVHLRRLA